MLNGLDAQVLGISTNHSDSQKAFANNLKLGFPLLSAFDQPDLITHYVGWLDKGRWLANRAYFVIDKEGTVQFKKVMQNPAELLSMEEIGKVLEELK